MSLNTIYLDTTYINCTQKEFPSREASSSEICNVVRELLFDRSKPIAIMVPKIGREQLLVDVAIEFKVGTLITYCQFILFKTYSKMSTRNRNVYCRVY